VSVPIIAPLSAEDRSRLLLYNIRYATGTGLRFNLPVPGAGYLRGTSRNLRGITDFIASHRPDIVALVEVDLGSLRAGRCQAELIAEHLGHDGTARLCKYAEDSVYRRLPLMSKQGNAVIASDVVTERFHYLEVGVKRLVIELELRDVTVFLVHLSVKYRQRQDQLRQLARIVRTVDRPLILAGDFNAFWGEAELELFLQATGLRSANRERLPTYPSVSPRIQLDFVFHSEEVEIHGLAVPRVRYSDHLPLLCDFSVRRPQAASPPPDVRR
jgi:endonuclease/exonuclease/phosphatase family metal-dependent hydrolase